MAPSRGAPGGGGCESREAPPADEGAASEEHCRQSTSTCSSGGRRHASPPRWGPGPGLAMRRYRMSMAEEDFMGEGASSICWKATDIETGENVAIKVYKRISDSRGRNVMLQKFARQVKVLQELQEPLVQPEDPSLWSPQLQNVKAHRLFMQLLDYSKDSEGNPAADEDDGIPYVVTELAQYSLKDYIQLRREQAKAVPKESIRHITKAIVLVVAGLHAKGLVHIDMKPENLMMFNGRLKLIDVDGCVRIGTRLSIQDSSISFSPCYCAPEWARFLIEDQETHITVTPSLDVWSVGMTIGELVTLDAILKPTYANFLCNGHSQREAGFLFMDWLSNIKKAPIPKSVEMFDLEFLDLLMNWLLVIDDKRRKTLAQSLDSPFIEAAAPQKGAASSASASRSIHEVAARCQSGIRDHLGVDEGEATAARKARNRAEDKSSTKPLHKGTLWKLNASGDPQDPAHWLRRDMWITSNGSLCYFSIKENRRLVMIDGSNFPTAGIRKFTAGAREYAFEVTYRTGDSDVESVSVFACESEEECSMWMTTLGRVISRNILTTIHFGGSLARDLKLFKLNVRNRRLKINKEDLPWQFKGILWKVKAEGDRMKEDDWFKRDFYISRTGSLAYYSVKEERELIYYTADDIARASFREIDNSESFRPWTFQVQLPPCGDVEFVAGEFAAETEEFRSSWIQELLKYRQDQEEPAEPAGA